MGLKNLIPLFVLVVVVGILGFVGFVVYSIVQEVSTKAREKIEKKNISITKGGLKVGVKELRDEEYRDRSQKYVLIFGSLFPLNLFANSKAHIQD